MKLGWSSFSVAARDPSWAARPLATIGDTVRKLNISGELVAGGVVILIGVVAVVHAFDYQFGTMRRMGPGAAPLAEGVALILLGALCLLESWREKPSAEIFPRRAFLAIAGGVLCWAVTVEWLGFVPATALLGFIASLAEGRFDALRSLTLSAVVTLFGVALFIWLLGLPIDLIKL